MATYFQSAVAVRAWAAGADRGGGGGGGGAAAVLVAADEEAGSGPEGTAGGEGSAGLFASSVAAGSACLLPRMMSEIVPHTVDVDRLGKEVPKAGNLGIARHANVCACAEEKQRIDHRVAISGR